MLIKVIQFCFVLNLLFITSCISDNNEKNSLKKIVQNNKKESEKFIENTKLDTFVQNIDSQLTKLTRIESLIYYKEDGSSISAVAYLDSNQFITKIFEDYLEAKSGNRIKTSFYFNNEIQFASKRESIVSNGKDEHFSEVLTFYDSLGNAILSKERISEHEENVLNKKFKKINISIHDNNNSYKILRQEGPYETTFQGFVESGQYQFLIVGERNVENGYFSSLSIQKDSPTLRYLRKEGKNALGRELKIDFERYNDRMGYTMIILKNVELVERK
jgi:hypothetical protein